MLGAGELVGRGLRCRLGLVITTLQAAHGYLELGMTAEADAEIESLPPEEKTRTEVLEMRLEIYREAKSWVLMEVVARELLRRIPERSMPPSLCGARSRCRRRECCWKRR